MNGSIGAEAVTPASLPLPELIHDIARGAQRARDLDRQGARALFAAMLEGVVPALELGAVHVAYRIKGESADELAGFMEALDERIRRWERLRERPVVLPIYDGANGQQSLSALLALLLKRYEVPVLLHGTTNEANDNRGAATAAILWELGIEPSPSIQEGEHRLASERLAYVPIDVLAPALVPLLALRQRLGLRSSAHTLAKLIDPFGGAGFRVIDVPHPEDLPRLRDYLMATRADALLLNGSGGEPFVNPQREPKLECFTRGVLGVMFEAEVPTPPTIPALPAAMDAPATAAWISAALAGEQPIPSLILNELACCLYATRRI